jgi:pimeloyl-ACP methyl ester carboxylesterase
MEEEYAQIAPNHEDWPTLVAKIKQLNLNIPNLPAEMIQSIKAPTLVIIGDSDVVLPEHAVEMFRLSGVAWQTILLVSRSHSLRYFRAQLM